MKPIMWPEDLLTTSGEAWVETLLFLALLAGMGYILVRKGTHVLLKRRWMQVRKQWRTRTPEEERPPHVADAEDFDRIFKP